MRSKLKIEDDPIAHSLPFEEDYKKHFYGTVALIEHGDHAGKVVVFPSTTFPCQQRDTPELAYEPRIVVREQGRKYVSYKCLTGIRYNHLAQHAPIPYGWYILGTSACMHLAARINVQWKVGMCGGNTYISTMTKHARRGKKVLFGWNTEKMTVGHTHDNIIVSEVLARINTFGIESVWCDPMAYNTETWDKSWDVEGYYPLGENLMVSEGLVFLAPTREPVAVRLLDGTFVAPHKVGVNLLKEEFGEKAELVSSSKFANAREHRKVEVNSGTKSKRKPFDFEPIKFSEYLAQMDGFSTPPAIEVPSTTADLSAPTPMWHFQHPDDSPEEEEL